MTRPDNNSSAEDRLIARFFQPLAHHSGAFGLGDDAAVITPPAGCDLVLTTDAIVAGVHFFASDPADTVAHKALRVNLSDLAAKGAKPLGYLITLVLDDNANEGWLEKFSQGLKADGEQFSCPLLGGDTVRTPGPVTISVAMFGSVPEGGMVRRAGAKPGDHVMVTGTIGDAALGLALRNGADWKLPQTQRDYLGDRYLLPRPRNAVSDAVRMYASAAMDISDGLAGDLGKLCRGSHVKADIAVVAVPLSEAARAVLAVEPATIEIILTGGDDYEIVCTVSPVNVAAFRAAAQAANVPVAEIGTVAQGDGVRFLDAGDKALTFKRASFSHF